MSSNIENIELMFEEKSKEIEERKLLQLMLMIKSQWL
jgi:hypothetical protein